jgi:hypothetical protein
VSRLALVVLLAGCGKYPFTNDPPQIDSINGQRPKWHNVSLFDVPDENGRIDIVIEAHDAEGDPIEIWFPRAPEGFEFDPHGLEGHWDVPEEGLTWEDSYLSLIVRDQHGEKSRSDNYYLDMAGLGLTFDTGAGDTGD